MLFCYWIRCRVTQHINGHHFSISVYACISFEAAHTFPIQPSVRCQAWIGVSSLYPPLTRTFKPIQYKALSFAYSERVTNEVGRLKSFPKLKPMTERVNINIFASQTNRFEEWRVSVDRTDQWTKTRVESEVCIILTCYYQRCLDIDSGFGGS